MSTHPTGSAASMVAQTANQTRCSQCGMLVPHYSTLFWSGHDGPFCESCWKARNSNKHSTLTELATITRLQEEVDTWKKHAAESDAELVAVWDALGLRKDPAGVTALDKIRDLIAKIGEQGDRLEAMAEAMKVLQNADERERRFAEAMKPTPAVEKWLQEELHCFRFWCTSADVDPGPNTIAIRDWLEAFLGESAATDPWKDRRGHV